MDCQELTRVIVASATFFALSQTASAEESRSDNRGPLTPITSVEQAQAIADFGVGDFPPYASMHVPFGPKDRGWIDAGLFGKLVLEETP